MSVFPFRGYGTDSYNAGAHINSMWLRFDGPLAAARTPLHAAILSDSFQCIEFLLENGASIEVRSLTYLSLLMLFSKNSLCRISSLP